jgi:hypothetical protein
LKKLIINALIIKKKMRYKKQYKVEATHRVTGKSVTVSISNDVMGSLMSMIKRDYSSGKSESFDACIYCEDSHCIEKKKYAIQLTVSIMAIINKDLDNIEEVKEKILKTPDFIFSYYGKLVSYYDFIKENREYTERRKKLILNFLEENNKTKTYRDIVNTNIVLALYCNEDEIVKNYILSVDYLNKEIKWGKQIYQGMWLQFKLLKFEKHFLISYLLGKDRYFIKDKNCYVNSAIFILYKIVNYFSYKSKRGKELLNDYLAMYDFLFDIEYDFCKFSIKEGCLKGHNMESLLLMLKSADKKFTYFFSRNIERTLKEIKQKRKKIKNKKNKALKKKKRGLKKYFTFCDGNYKCVNCLEIIKVRERDNHVKKCNVINLRKFFKLIKEDEECKICYICSQICKECDCIEEFRKDVEGRKRINSP